MSLSLLDYVLLGMLAVSSLIGLFRGFFREAMSLLVWIAAVWVAVRYAGALAPQFARWIGNAELRLWAARILLLIAVLASGGILTWLMAMAVHGSGLGGSDRVVGAVFGFVRGVVLAGLTVITLKLAGFSDEPWWRQSKLIPYAAPVADALREAAEKGLDGSWHLPASQAPGTSAGAFRS